LLTVAVQRGAKAMDVYVLRFDGTRLVLVDKIEGRGTFAFQLMGTPPRWVIVSDPDYVGELPELYAWTGSHFTRSDRDFPGFWTEKAASYAKTINQPQPLPAYVLFQMCWQTARAFELAGKPKRARRPCMEARQRIAYGRGIWRGTKVPPDQLLRQQQAAIVRINKLLAQL
jgi:hypothetical protein